LYQRPFRHPDAMRRVAAMCLTRRGCVEPAREPLCRHDCRLTMQE
jgi:hypothetical protein